MAQTYFRVQGGDRNVAELLDPAEQISRAWRGTGYADRKGISACESLEDLALYLATPHAALLAQAMTDNWVIVEMEADTFPGSKPVDPIEVLVLPTAIVSVRPVDDAFRALIAEQDAFLESFVEPDPFADEDEAN